MKNKPEGYPEKYSDNILLLLKWREKDYLENLKEEEETYDIECPNFKVCGSKINLELANDCHHGRCLYCDILFGEWHGGKGNLIFKLQIECPICLETKVESVSYPKCNHIVCIECFKECFFPKIKISNAFPYPDLWDEYNYADGLLDRIEMFKEDELEDEDKLYLKKEEKFKYKDLISNEEKEMFKWLEDEKIKLWKEKEIELQDEIYEKNDASDNLRKCPLCRQ